MQSRPAPIALDDVDPSFSNGMQLSSVNIEENDAPVRSRISLEQEHFVDEEEHKEGEYNNATTESILRNFFAMSCLFSSVPASALACLSLATAKLGQLGAWQSGVLFLSYTLCAVTGAIHVVKRLGSKRGIMVGMSLFCAYIGCFFMAIVSDAKSCFALTGAAIGGIGAGILWTSQGTYFTEAAEEYAKAASIDVSQATSKLGGTFAFVLLAEETTLDLLSTFLVRELKVHWAIVFSTYFIVAATATCLMALVKAYPLSAESGEGSFGLRGNSSCYHSTATIQLLINDSKMKYMIGLNAAFGFAGAFLDSFVNGQVVPTALNDARASFVGILVAFHGIAAAISSLVFGRVSQRVGKGPILYFGAVCFAWVAIPFLIQPNLKRWTFGKLVGVYCIQGIGRATFEGTLKAMFADFFSYEKEAAFANIILQSGLTSAVAYVLSANLSCQKVGTYCLQYRDGSLHNIGTLAMCTVLASLLGMVGFARASCLQSSQGHHPRPSSKPDAESNPLNFRRGARTRKQTAQPYNSIATNHERQAFESENGIL